MYTTQQKRETVERFLSSGLTISAASRLEGYPERHRLASWLREAREGSLVVTPTPAPGRVVAEVTIDAPRPRPPEFRGTPAFAAYCARLSAAIAQASLATELS